MIMTGNIELTTLTDSNADSFLLKLLGTSGHKHILIDGGFKGDGRKALKLIEKILEEGGKIDLVILTHVDQDHVNGLLALFESDSVNSGSVGKVVFNVPHSEAEIKVIKEKSTQCGYQEGNTLLGLIISKGIKLVQAHQGCKLKIDENVVIDILSPTKEALEVNHDNWRETNIGHDEDEEYDKNTLLTKKYKEDDKPQNLSSIVCLITCDEEKMLFCGDSVPSQILSADIECTPVTLFKVPHHGSKYNISQELLDKFPAVKYLIPGNRSSYPNYYTVALIEENAKQSDVFVPKGSWVHSKRRNNEIELNFLEYEFGTKVKL
ncbi:TPA: MBL fold metallo-hydrolase [Vibrio parahaemolyticus]|nr:MBL fold metallo-hydrolase [Vibrio parahaemolyticus]HAS6735238.1 MBL fold metallo-hydrolase [Vibrio parahaemolyticus]HAS6847708.1 MBL fold metallo-hydrolase [Vibrio parahaemolyticus]